MLFLFSLSTAIAQVDQTQITGKVTDQSGEVLIGVNILVEGTNNGTATDFEGKFTLQNVNIQSDVLLVSYVGYKTKKLPLNGQSDLTIILESDSRIIDQVVVTALGLKKESRSLGFSTQTIDGREINEIKNSSDNVLRSLSGRLPGATISSSGSGPGGSVRVVLRGNKSISGSNNALIVIDGVPVSNSHGSQPDNEFGGYSSSDGASNINPDDIESISILKGPSAAALYGSRAANGAIMITTKKGVVGDLRVNYNGGFGIDIPNILMDFQNQYGRGSGGQHAPESGLSWGAPSETYPDNVSDFYRNAASMHNSFNISGGTEKIQVYTSYKNTYHEGIIPRNVLKRNTINLRINNNITDKLSTDAKITYINQATKNKPWLGEYGLPTNVLIMPRDASPEELSNYESISEIGQPTPNRSWPVTNDGIYQHPYWLLNRTSYNEGRDRVILLGTVNYDIVDWLSIQGRFNTDRYVNNTDFKGYEGTTIFASQPGGRYYETQNEYVENNFDILLSGQNEFIGGLLGLDYNFGGSYVTFNSKSTRSEANGLLYPNKFFLNFASNPSSTNGISRREIQSVYGSIQFSLKDQLYMDVTGRNDWSSTLPKPHSFFYPSVGLSLILSDMINTPTWLTYAKLRATYTEVGNDAPPFRINQTYGFSQGGTGGLLYRDGTRAISDLKPELTESLEAGVDLSLFGNRINFEVTVYRSNTKNQLLSLGLPTASGFRSQFINAGNIENSGFEFLVSSDLIEKEDFTWNSSVNIGRNVNKIIELHPDVDRAVLGGNDRLGTIVVQEGGAFGDIYGQTWAMEDGKRIVNKDGLPIVINDEYIGNYNPDYTFGWFNNWKWKNFNLSLLIDGLYGGTLISGTDNYLATYGLGDYTLPYRDGGWILDAITESGEVNTSEIDSESFWNVVGQGGREGWPGIFAFDRSNIRLREVSLGYFFDINNKIIDGIRLSFVANNLMFLYRGKAQMSIPGLEDRPFVVDPDLSLGTGNSQGLESGLPPSIRTIGMNVKLSF